ncbi:SDR family oxidoreductase [Nocardioides sp. Bht2]|uniref:SDR family oxidoreductase n=1 Tax=Nocardioides sp. Bht2 TaxID=3392297 RepID=UPI0039B387D4
MRLHGKTILITGAGGGIGAATARLAAREGASHVFLADIDEQLVAQATDEVSALGARATALHLDVVEEADWIAAVAEVESTGDGLDILVNNAGLSGGTAIDPYDSAHWHTLMDTNAAGTFLGMHHGMAAMRRTGRGGSVVNVSSVSGLIGQDYVHLGYSASKGAVRMLSKAGAVRHGPEGIRVNSVYPGVMPPMRSAVTTRGGEAREAAVRGIPLQRQGEVDEVATAIVFLASDEASYITGAELVVDGGWTSM